METIAEERRARASEIVVTLQEHLSAILHDRPVLAAYVYGSVAAGCPLPTSDVDIALVWMPDCELDAYARLQAELEIAIESDPLSTRLPGCRLRHRRWSRLTRKGVGRVA